MGFIVMHYYSNRILWKLLVNGLDKNVSVVLFPAAGLIGIPIMNKLIEKYDNIIEIAVLAVIVKIGVLITHESLQYSEYKFHEAWLFFYWMYLVMSISTWFYWKRMVAIFWIVQIYSFIQLHLKYAYISSYMYTGWIFIWIFFPWLSMVVAKILLGFILMLSNNHELINTVKKILQVFPEGIVIQSFDENTQKLVVKFVNNTATKEIINYTNYIGKEIDDNKLEFKIEINKSLSELDVSWDNINLNSKLTLSEILKSQIEEANLDSSHLFLRKTKVWIKILFLLLQKINSKLNFNEIYNKIFIKQAT